MGRRFLKVFLSGFVSVLRVRLKDFLPVDRVPRCLAEQIVSHSLLAGVPLHSAVV